MVNLYLKIRCEMEGVTNLGPTDTEAEPYEYKFRIECTRCRQVHSKPVTINRFEQIEVQGSKGNVNFSYRCKECKAEHSANIEKTGELHTAERGGKPTSILMVDARGIEFLEFVPDGKFECVGGESGTKFGEIDLSDGEWYDYDEKAGSEVSITDVKWEITR